MTQRERYYNDPVFHSLVDTMVAHIMQAKLTPSEMRDAALMASIIYEEQHRPLYKMLITKETIEAIEWIDSKIEP